MSLHDAHTEGLMSDSDLDDAIEEYIFEYLRDTIDTETLLYYRRYAEGRAEVLAMMVEDGLIEYDESSKCHRNLSI